ncbi:MAG: pilus assembly protein TadG-related protein [Dehalococcoidia bacterium]
MWLCAFMLAILLGMVAMVVDVGNFLHERAQLQTVVDAAALAAAQELPDNDTMADDVALEYAAANHPTLDLSNVNSTFYCFVGDDDDNGVPDANDIPAACNPGSNAAWTCGGGACASPCFPNEGDKCNTISVGAENSVSFIFAPVIGMEEADTGTIHAAACHGACGGPAAGPLDVVMIIDRSSSMSSSELNDAKTAARAVLDIFNPAQQHVALGVLGASDPSNLCNDEDPDDGGTWLAVPLSSDFKNSDGTLNTSSSLVSTINCLTSSSQGTNLGSPINDEAYGQPDAMSHLLTSGRPGVKKAIILFTDGAANQPTSTPATNTGWLNCAAQAATTGGDNNGFQTTPIGACADAGTEASDANSGTGTSTSCTNSGKDKHIFYDYNISAPAGNTIDGIEVRLDARINTASGTRRMCVQLSWDGGTTWTSTDQTSNLSTSQQTYTLGDNDDDWGHTWTANELTNANFRVRVIDVADSTSRTFLLDWVSIRVHSSQSFDACEYAFDQAETAKAADIEIFALGYGLENEECGDSSSSPYNNQSVTELLGDMATDSEDETGCDNASEAAQENGDGDHFYCETDSSGLSAIFQQAAEQLATGSRLVRLPF